MLASSLLPEERRSLPPPPYQTMGVETLNSADADVLLHGIKVSRYFLEKCSAIRSHTRADLAALSKLTYKNHSRFRNDHGLREVKMILKSARVLEEDADLWRLVRNFSELLPAPLDVKSVQLKRRLRALYLPTLEVLQHLLVRLHGIATLIWRLVSRCVKAGGLAAARIRLGHFWSVGLGNLAGVSRLRVLWMSLLLLVENAFDCFKRFQSFLPSSKVAWLPDGYEMADNIYSRIVGSADGIGSFSKGDPGSFAELFRPEMSLDDLPEAPAHRTLSEDPANAVPAAAEPSTDTGEVISRTHGGDPAVTADQHPHPSASRKKTVKLRAKVEQALEGANIREFVDSEAALRKRDRKSALTKVLEKGQWKELAAQLNLLATKAEGSKKGRRKAVEKAKELILSQLLQHP